MTRIAILKNFRMMHKKIQNPKSRPNNFQQFILSALGRGMNIQDASRIFELSPVTIGGLPNRFPGGQALDDLHFFVLRAHDLGASDEIICQWFGIDRADKVAMMIAKAQGSS